ncbi:hypothetical protein F5880DRAFT_1617333 [Lentinula raphanica]|nr:hypothetical protein F5880DRAFT_1617333 [Lentinula raphanica]
MNEHAYASDSRSSHCSPHPPDSPPSSQTPSQTPSASLPLSRDCGVCVTEVNGFVHHVQQELTQPTQLARIDAEDEMNPGLFPALGEGADADADSGGNDYCYAYCVYGCFYVSVSIWICDHDFFYQEAAEILLTSTMSLMSPTQNCPLPVPPHLTLLIPIPIDPLVQTTMKSETHCPVSAFKTRLEQLRQRTVERAGCPTTGETRDELGDEHQEDQNEEDQENKDRQEKAEEMRKEEEEDKRNEERGGEGVWGGSVRGSTVASKSSREEKED